MLSGRKGPVHITYIIVKYDKILAPTQGTNSSCSEKIDFKRDEQTHKTKNS